MIQLPNGQKTPNSLAESADLGHDLNHEQPHSRTYSNHSAFISRHHARDCISPGSVKYLDLLAVVLRIHYRRNLGPRVLTNTILDFFPVLESWSALLAIAWNIETKSLRSASSLFSGPISIDWVEISSELSYRPSRVELARQCVHSQRSAGAGTGDIGSLP